MPIDDDLRRLLEGVVERARLPIDLRCRALLDALIETGVHRLQTVSIDDPRIAEAADRLRVLLDDMTQQARILRLDVLCEPTLASALERHGLPWPVE